MTDDEKRELIAEAREWVQEENWESDHERAGFNRPGTGLVARLADALEGTLTEPEWEEEIQYGNLTAIGFLVELRGRNYATHQRTFRMSNPVTIEVVSDV